MPKIWVHRCSLQGETGVNTDLRNVGMMYRINAVTVGAAQGELWGVESKEEGHGGRASLSSS